MRFWLGLVLPIALAACNAGCKSSEPPPAPAQIVQTGLCEHGVPAAVCTKCNPEVIPVFQSKGDWCDEHGLPESHCLECNPNLRFGEEEKAAADWCAEHGLPESQCTRCNPELVGKYIEAGDYCREHGYPQSACPICKGTHVFPPPGMKVRLASAATAADVGLETVRATRRPFGSSLQVVGVLAFDPALRASVSSLDEAVVRKVHVDIGDVVEKGAPLVTLSSVKIGEGRATAAASRSRAETARVRLEREEALHQKGISSRAEVEAARRELAEAEAALASARSILEVSGAAGGGRQGTFVLSAPLSGVVASRPAGAGQAVTGGEVLVEVADPRSLWAWLDLPQRAAADVVPGQSVSIRLEGRNDERSGVITAVAPTVDPSTRTVRARVVVKNERGDWKAGSFVRASISTGGDREALVIPKAALQRGEGKPIVFVQEQVGVYRPVAVETGTATGGDVEILRGLEEGDEVVTTGAFLLATETRKDSIGAGCCEVD